MVDGFSGGSRVNIICIFLSVFSLGYGKGPVAGQRTAEGAGVNSGIDKVIGHRIKVARQGLSFSQMELAERIGVSFQQVQKYEKGVTRISVFRLTQIADALGLPVRVLLEEEGEELAVGEPAVSYRRSLPLAAEGAAGREEARLLALFRKLADRRLRAGVLQQLQGLVALQDGGGKKP